MKNISLSNYSVPLMLLIAASAPALAQSYSFEIQTDNSAANFDAETVVDTAGTLIGDYDIDTNPDGTQTRPGVFGGAGNQPIDTSTSLATNTALSTNPSGSFVVSPNFDLGLIEIDDLLIDVLNGHEGVTNLSVTLLYETFHTVSPSFLYLGGVPFTVPLGEIGNVSQSAITQEAPAVGSLSPTDDPSIFDINVLVPVLLDMQFSFALPGSEPTDLPVDALPVVLPVIGQLEILDSESFLVSMTIAPDPIGAELPLDVPALPGIPLELPTFGTDSASVILTMSPNTLGVDAAMNLEIVALGSSVVCPADLDGDGVLNFFDVSAFLNAFAAKDQLADFNTDGEFNFFDVSAFLNAFTSGCL